MTSLLLMAPKVTHTRIVNHLWVNQAPYADGPIGTTARKVNPITRQKLPKHKAYRLPRRPK